jgi:hypothetical protein
MWHICSLASWCNGLQNSSTTSIVWRPFTQFTREIESDSIISFLDVLVTRKGSALATEVYRKPIHTGRYLNFKSNHPLHVKRGIIQIYTTKLLPYAMNDMVCLMRLTTWDVIFSSFITTNGSSTQFLIPRVVFQIKRQSPLTLCLSPMRRALQGSSNIWGTVTTLEQSPKLTHSREFTHGNQTENRSTKDGTLHP